MSEVMKPDYSNSKYRAPEPKRELTERERFEEWWAAKMGDHVPGSKSLARNAWLAALWAHGVKTRLPSD